MNHAEQEYINSSQARKLLDVTTSTLRSWAEKDKIRFIRTVSNHRLYNRTDIYNILGRTTIIEQKKSYIYARVSSKKQMDDLQRQCEFLQTKFPNHLLVTDIASGINWKRKGLKTILEQAMQGLVTELVVAHKDQLCRFAWELLEFIFEQSNTKLLVIDEEKGKSTEQELAEDLLSIVHIYTCRNMGRRRYSNNPNTNVSNPTTKENTESVDGNNEIRLQ